LEENEIQGLGYHFWDQKIGYNTDHIVYAGHFEKGVMHDKEGLFIYPNDDRFIANVSKGKILGFGKFYKFDKFKKNEI